MTASPPRTACWRAVVSAELRVGRGSVLGPDTTRRARWWELGLKCGHKTQRTVRYKRSDNPQRGGTQRRDIDDVLPAPKRVRCELCEAAAARREDADGANWPQAGLRPGGSRTGRGRGAERGWLGRDHDR